jgi:hypothetical protein
VDIETQIWRKLRMFKRENVSRLAVLCLVFLVGLPAFGQVAEGDGSTFIAAAKFKTYCFDSAAACSTSQAAATCQKSGCYEKSGKQCYDCYFGPVSTDLEAFLAWLEETAEEE